MFHFAETSWLERFRLRALLFGGLTMLAALISLTGVISRVGSAADARLRQRHSENVPRTQAELALNEAREAFKAAEAAASAECSSGRGSKCLGLEEQEKSARQRVEDARTKLDGVGAHTVEDPLARRLAAIIPGLSEGAIQLYLQLMFPMWLELSGLVLVSFGLAPPRRKVRSRARKRRAQRAIDRGFYFARANSPRCHVEAEQ
jgi:hypothetical protein